MNPVPVVLVYNHFYPDYTAGGPVTSIANLTRLLAKEVSVRILTSAYEYQSGKPIQDVKKNEWTKWNDIPIWYSGDRKSTKRALKGLSPGSVLYLNGLYSFSYFIYPLWLSRKFKLNVIISPRGMLQEGALRHGYIKKKIYLALLKSAGLFKNTTWHATDVQEEKDIGIHIGANRPVRVIANVPRVTSRERQELKKEPGELKLVYFSLIARKKNLHFFLKLLQSPELQHVHLDIIGPVKDVAYWDACKKLLSKIPSPERAVYKGDISPEEVENVLGQYHALALPTLGENFGHAITESLACSRPVVISDKTPWSDVADYGAGYALSLDANAWMEALRKMLNWSQQDFDSAASAANKYYQSKFNFDELKMRYLDLFSTPA